MPRNYTFINEAAPLPDLASIPQLDPKPPRATACEMLDLDAIRSRHDDFIRRIGDAKQHKEEMTKLQRLADLLAIGQVPMYRTSVHFHWQSLIGHV